MTFAGTDRRRQLVTAVLGTVLILAMGAALIMGFRLATHMRANINALQTASTLQTYPEEIAHQLNTLRDRLEVRAYAGQALADLQSTVKRFAQKLEQLNVAGEIDSPQLHARAGAVAPVHPGARPGHHLQRPAVRGLGHRRQLAVARGTRALRRGQACPAVRQRQRRAAAGAAGGARRHAATHLAPTPRRGCAPCCLPVCWRRWHWRPRPPTSS